MNLPTHGTSANIRDFDSSVCTGVVQGENTEILFRLLSFPTFYFGRYEFRPLSKDRLQSCGLVFLALSLSFSYNNLCYSVFKYDTFLVSK